MTPCLVVLNHPLRNTLAHLGVAKTTSTPVTDEDRKRFLAYLAWLKPEEVVVVFDHGEANAQDARLLQSMCLSHVRQVRLLPVSTLQEAVAGGRDAVAALLGSSTVTGMKAKGGKQS